jgi:hypothetical protein
MEVIATAAEIQTLVNQVNIFEIEIVLIIFKLNFLAPWQKISLVSRGKSVSNSNDR